MEFYDLYIKKLDTTILELLAQRKKHKLNARNFKFFELGGYNVNDNFASNIDYKIYNFELIQSKKKNNSLKSYEKPFNECLYSNNVDDLESLNLNSIIKTIYSNSLYDICIYGDSEDFDYICELDIEILYTLSDRIHFGYELIKYKYINNKDFYDKLIMFDDDILLEYYLYCPVKQKEYMTQIIYKCNELELNTCAIYSMYKTLILPLTVEIQKHFCTTLRKLKQKCIEHN
tara:strand:+ start:5178 stop:5870 length:693 start_codon:yes stop_codon:yes gene_type:complete